jgi:SAM-dependent methyltransferase
MSRKSLTNNYFDIREHCPACNSENFKIIYQKPYDQPPIKEYLEMFYEGKIKCEYLEGAAYVLCICNNCNLIYQREIPNSFYLEKFYNNWISPQPRCKPNKPYYDLGYYSYYAQEIMQMIAFLGKMPSSLSIFDFGMGWGKWALMAKAFGCESYGSELSEDLITYAKLNGIKIVSWNDIPKYQFDIINTTQVFEHLSEPLQTLKHLKKALKPQGIIKINVPLIPNDLERQLKITDWKSKKGQKFPLNPVAPLEHLNCFKRKSLIIMAKEAGMEPLVIPIRTQLKYSTDWNGIKRSVLNFLRPIYRNFLGNYMFFKIIRL